MRDCNFSPKLLKRLSKRIVEEVMPPMDWSEGQTRTCLNNYLQHSGMPPILVEATICETDRKTLGHDIVVPEQEVMIMDVSGDILVYQKGCEDRIRTEEEDNDAIAARTCAGPTADDKGCILQWWRDCSDSGLHAVHKWTLQELSAKGLDHVPLVWYPSTKSLSKISPQSAWKTWLKYVSANRQRFQSVTFSNDVSRVPTPRADLSLEVEVESEAEAEPSLGLEARAKSVVWELDRVALVVDKAHDENAALDMTESTPFANEPLDLVETPPVTIDLQATWKIADIDLHGHSCLQCAEVMLKQRERRWAVLPSNQSDPEMQQCPEFLCPSMGEHRELGAKVYANKKMAEQARNWLILLLHSNPKWRGRWMEDILEGRDTIVVTTGGDRLFLCRRGNDEYLLHPDGAPQDCFKF